MRAIGDRVIVTSRGIKEEMKSGLVVPAQFLRKSNVCTDSDGRTWIIRDRSENELPDGRWVVDRRNLLAQIEEGRIIPQKGVVYARKCEDPDDGVLRADGKRHNQFAEILAAGPRTGIEEYAGAFAFVKLDAAPQAVEDGDDEWLIDIEDIEFVTTEGTDE
jgi:hypothetical protein